MKSKIQEALEQGYSPSEVLDYLANTKWQSEQSKITEARKEGYTDDQILNYLGTPKTGGMLEAGIGGAKELAASTLTAVQTPFLSDEEVAQRAEARREKITERPGFSLDEIKKAYGEGFIPGTKELLSEIPSAITSQLPNFAAMAAGAKAGAAFTPPVLPIVGPFAKPIGAALGAFGASYLPISGSQVERQIEEDKAAGRPVEIDRLSAYGTAIPSALLDVGAMQVGLGKFLGLTKLGTRASEKAAQETLEKIAKESALKSGAVGVGKLVGAEVPTEVVQQMIERYQADLPLTTPDAIKEYTEIAAQTAALGPLGAVSRLSERGEARSTLQQDEQRRQQTLARIDSERQRINEIVLAAQSEAETKQAAEEAAQLAKDSLNELGNYAPEKSKIARSIKTMQTAFDKAIEQNDLDAQKAAIAELTNVPTSLVSLATMPKVVNDKTFADMGIGPTATIRKKKELHGLDPQIPAENEQIRNALTALLETKQEGSKQYEGIKKYLSSIPTTYELKGYTKDETTIPEGSRESIEVSGQPVAGGVTAGVEGVDGTGLGGTTDNVQQLAGREGPRPAALAPETTEVLPSANEMIKNYEGDTLFQFLGKKGGINYSNIAELTGEDKIPNRRGAFSLFRREGGNDIIEMIESGELDEYLPYDAKLQGGSQEFSGQPFDIEPAIDYIQNAFRNNEDVRDYDFETELANVKNQEREFERQAAIPSEEEVNKDVQEVAAEIKGRDVLFAEPKQQLGEPNPILSKVTNGKELLKTATKLASNRSDKAIINMLEKVPNLDTVKVITENTSTDPKLQGASGYFDPNTNTIFVDPRVSDLAHIVEHELLHAATDAEFDKHVKIVNNVHTALTPLGKKAVKLFEAFIDASLKSKQGFYAQKNVKEFFMEGNTDPALKQFLQNKAGVLGLKPAKGKIQTLWSDFVNIIKSMFGIPEYAHSMLDEVLLLTPEFTKGPGAVTTGKEIVQARTTPEGMTRPDGTPLKYVEDTKEGIIQKFKNVFNDDTNQWRKWMDQLGNKIVGGRYSVERKALDADLPAVDAYREGKIRGDLINLQAYNSMSLAQAGLYLGRLLRRKSGLIIADESTGADKVKMLDISKNWNELVDRATQDLGSKELAYDMLVAGYYGPRYAELAEFNKTASSDEKINIDEWTESDKRTAAEAYRRYGPELKRLQDMRNVQRKDLLDFMVDTGLYTREKADRFLKRAEYVALYRVPEEEIDSFDRPTTKGAGLLGAGKEYRLVGSKRAAADPIDNYIANMSWMMQRGIKNNAAKSTADMMQQLGVGQWYDRPMTDVEKKAYHHITVHVNGLPKDFRVLDPNDMAAFSASPIISGAVWDIMKYPVSGLRHGITMMPQFVWNQAWEDPIRATFTSGNKAGFLNNITKTWKSIANNQFKADRTPNAAMLNRYGIVGQKDVLDSADIINLYKGKDKKLWEKSLFFFERMAQGSDLGAREAIYENAIKELEAEGYDRETAEDLAAVRSHQYMPYQQMGMSRSLAYLRRMMPFVNPPIQGMARDIAAARGRISGISKAEGKKLLVFRLSKYLMFTAMYAAFMSGDDEYENQSEEQQNNNFFIGGLRMPVPQELRPLKVAAERGTRAWVLNAPKADIEDMDVAAAALRKTWELIAGFAPIPSAVRPLAENYTNFDIFSGLPVVSAGQQRKEPYLQYTEKTSEIAKLVGAQLNYSPIKIDKLLKGYFGYLGQTLGQVSNYFVGDRPAPTANDIIFVGSMLENQRATGNRGDFYDLYDKVVTAKTSANALLEEGRVDEYRDYISKNRGYIAIEKPINNLHNQLTKLRDYKKIIMASNRNAEEKREALDRLTESENNMLNNIKDLNRRAVEINKQD